LGIQEGFHHADHGAGDKDLVAILGVSGPCPSTHAGDIFPIVQRRAVPFEDGIVSTTMMASVPPVPYITARDRGIE